MAGMERTRIKDRMVRGKEFKRSDPCSQTDPLPEGVKFDKGQFQYTEESVRVAVAFDRVLRGDTLTGIAKDLGFRSTSALRATLRSYWWIGVKATTKRRIDRKVTNDGRLSDGKKVMRDKPIFVDTNLVEHPLVTKQVFESVQEVLSVNRKTWTQRKSWSNSFLAVGLLFCRCGTKIYLKVDKRPGKRSYYVCSSHNPGRKPCPFPPMRTAFVDDLIVEHIMDYLLDARFISHKIRESMSTEKQVQHLRRQKAIEKVVAELERERNNLLDAIQGLGYRPDLGERLKVLDEQSASAKQKLRAAESEVVLNTTDVDALAQQITHRFCQSYDWPMEQQKRVLAETVERITVDLDSSEVHHVEMTLRVGMPEVTKCYDGEIVLVAKSPTQLQTASRR